MNCSMMIPPAPLNLFIERFWLLDDEALAYSATVFPDGVVQLIFNLGAPYSVHAVNATHANEGSPSAHSAHYDSFAKGSLSGERMEPWSVEQQRSCHCLGVRFRPGGAYPFFQIPLGQFQEKTIDIELLWGASELDLLREQLYEAGEPQRQFAVLAQALMRRAGANLYNNSTVEIALQMILNYDDPCIRDIANRIGISHKHLLRQFDKYVGINPKALVRLQRFQRTLKTLANPANASSLTEVAYECSYYDQAHFVHEFEALATMKPSDYVRSVHSLRHKGMFTSPVFMPIQYYTHNLLHSLQ
jgi:AraC-like DNA-binding protein